MSELEGHCLCGAVKFAVTPPTLFFAHCHCRYCRDAHGAAFVSWAGVAEARFHYLHGSAEPKWYQSSQQSRRGFCVQCGTTMFFTSTLCPGEIHIARPAIQGPIDREPQCHVFYDQHADWIEVGDRLPRYTSEEPGLGKYKAVRS
ncbi:MAG: GFA family protein [Steroidobacteraceae bacterium]